MNMFEVTGGSIVMSPWLNESANIGSEAQIHMYGGR